MSFWTIDEWRNAQLKDDGLSRLLELVNRLEGPAWLYVASEAEIRSQWDELLSCKDTSSKPLFGVPYAVKDNIDVFGMPTTAACERFKYVPDKDAHIVALLRKAGAIVVGKTNLDQFATGLVGVRSPYGFPSCVFSKDHVPGGSSSGSAVVVGNGTVPFALGTDTAGSGRVPAALNNLIGLKPTVGLWSTSGVVPACRSLDTATVFALGLHDAQTVFSIAADYDQPNPYSRPLPERPLKSFGRRPLVGVPTSVEFYGEEENHKLYEAAVEKLGSHAGVELVKVDCSDLYKLAKLLYEGPWVAERYWACKDIIENHPEDMDPTVRGIVAGGANVSAVDAFDKEYVRQEIKKKVQSLFANIDALVMPTCPLNPKIAEVLAEPVTVNSRQGTYTNFVNLSDLSGLAIPSGFRSSDGLPVGITLLGKPCQDYALLDLASRFLETGRLVGCSKSPTNPTIDDISTAISKGERYTMPLVVVGAHLSGMPLNWQLRKVGATLVKRTTTSDKYKLYALPTDIPKPGIVRVSNGGVKIAVEVWDVPVTNYGEFVAMVPPPLGIGSLELADGNWVKGFICEPACLEGNNVKDISSFGGWRNYISSLDSGKPFSKVLVANRGEIAVRLIKTLKKLGIASVAVFSEADRLAQHVSDADESVDLKGTTAAETYLSIRKIIDAAKQTGAVAILPGYGFLSENADFADACYAEGIVFCGPSGNAMRKLGLKHSAREIARNANVPLAPGTDLIDTVEEALELVPKIGGYPVMIKSTAGGGGIGLQRVDTDEELKRAYATVRHQGQAYFGDSGVFMESFVENARHVEVQVFGDGLGNAVALGERDCSLQRRNQKIIEETPAPLVPPKVTEELLASGRALVASMNYKGAGTVEYIYDGARKSFYFLEVNARLQVEHPITEMVTGLDLVEWMLLVAADRPPFNASTVIKREGAAMEARLYAENPVRDFRPSPGQLTQVEFPSWARIDGWVKKGSVISSEYDPTVAKIIVKGSDRNDALKKLLKALNETRIDGVVTNIDYLKSIVSSNMFKECRMHTKVLDTYNFTPDVIEIAQPGSATSIQDWPGRTLLWHIGVPPSGPMDSFAHRVANYLVGNKNSAPAIEVTLNGPTVIFHSDSTIAVTGGSANITLDGKSVSQWQALNVKAGQKLSVGKIVSGCRAYIAIRGGLDVPEYLGSRSTFAQGLLGGYNGRNLKFGDVIPISSEFVESAAIPEPFPGHLVPTYSNEWEVGVTVGPHGAPDFFTEDSIDEFFASEWKVHYNSNRFGVRLIGPKPQWARADGGEGGLHPSNAHDYVYSLGAINFTGDEPVILTCDGPSLGGFVCAAVIVEAEMWKIGQVKPGDRIRFVPIKWDTALELKSAVDSRVKGKAVPLPTLTSVNTLTTKPVLFKDTNKPGIVYRQAGDRYVLVEYGDNVMDLNLRYRVHQLTAKVLGNIDGVLEMSPGVRSVLIEYEPTAISQSHLMEKLTAIEKSMPFASDWKISSRILHLPMAFEDSKTMSAVQRYAETIRSEAPWLPNNVDFLADVNKFSSRNDVRNLMYSASFMVLGLGDVYLGAPCAVPLDPRHRILGTKYNPSRSWTPNGTVGLGGMYMCIYTMESPGGYQLIGRTVPIWDKLCLNDYSNGKPWLLKEFDQVRYYAVSEDELEELVQQVNTGTFQPRIEESTFDSVEYAKFLKINAESIADHISRISSQQKEFGKLIAASNREIEKSTVAVVDTSKFSDKAEFVYSELTGRFWKKVASEGENIEEGAAILILEAMKTEMTVSAPKAGKLVQIVHKNGDMVETGDLVAVIEP